MADAADTRIEDFLRAQYAAWNLGQKDELFELFRQIAPNGYTIEFIGGPIVDGETALKDLFDKYVTKTKTELMEVKVNGQEAAAYVRNHHFSPTSYSVNVSIETYHFGDGKLHVRYFH